jgi:hypothetical protein
MRPTKEYHAELVPVKSIMTGQDLTLLLNKMTYKCIPHAMLQYIHCKNNLKINTFERKKGRSFISRADFFYGADL